jgi:hypothetical protein
MLSSWILYSRYPPQHQYKSNLIVCRNSQSAIQK